MPVAIPDELVGLFREGRVIPFVGAGMSANVGYPSWDALLKRLGESLERGDLTHDQIVDLTGGNRLRVAEYYFLTEGKQVGPLRKEIHSQFRDVSPLDFGGYVDLVNLGSQRIYTTNFDDLIERTYRELGILYERIATPRDLALSAGNKTEIIKYHGDLTNDPSLVLTESQYYRRLNFDSPMDLKFRADLLGKSVMFIGYSFSDINIRIIWFRLLDMMQGVEQADMPTSYMIIIKPNPVEELLYRDAGIETIVLDPSGEAEPEDFPVLVGDFLYDLMCRVCDPDIPGSNAKPFVSKTLLRRAASSARGRRPRWIRADSADMRRLSTFELPEQYLREALALFSDDTDTTESSIRAAVALYRRSPEEEDVKKFLLRSAVEQPSMKLLDQTEIDWQSMAAISLAPTVKGKILAMTRLELDFHDDNDFGTDLFFEVFLVKQLSQGDFGATEEEREEAEELLQAVEERCPGVVEDLWESGRGRIEEVAGRYQPVDEEEDGHDNLDDLPFE